MLPPARRREGGHPPGLGPQDSVPGESVWKNIGQGATKRAVAHDLRTGPALLNPERGFVALFRRPARAPGRRDVPDRPRALHPRGARSPAIRHLQAVLEAG